MRELENKDKKSKKIIDILKKEDEFFIVNGKLEQNDPKNNPIDWKRVKEIIIFQLIIFIDILIEGNNKVSSIIGIER